MEMNSKHWSGIAKIKMNTLVQEKVGSFIDC